MTGLGLLGYLIHRFQRCPLSLGERVCSNCLIRQGGGDRPACRQLPENHDAIQSGWHWTSPRGHPARSSGHDWRLAGRTPARKLRPGDVVPHEILGHLILKKIRLSGRVATKTPILGPVDLAKAKYPTARTGPPGSCPFGRGP
jgi:hypothetical protein